jgi:hypothetical protein
MTPCRSNDWLGTKVCETSYAVKLFKLANVVL